MPRSCVPSKSGAETDGVEALLDDGGPDVRTTGIVPVRLGRERMARGDRGGLDGTRRQAADAAQVRRRQAAADLGEGLAVAVAQEDRGPVRLEEHHGVIDEPAEDPVELEPAADVARDAAQRLGPVQVLGDLRGTAAHADDPADRLGSKRRQVDVPIRQGLAGHEQHAPRPGWPGDRHGQLGRRLGHDRCQRSDSRQVRIGAPREPCQGTGDGALRAAAGECPAKDAAVGRHGDEAAGEGTGRCARHELVVDQLPGGDQLDAKRFTEDGHGVMQGTIDVAGRPGQPHQLGHDPAGRGGGPRGRHRAPPADRSGPAIPD